MKKECSVEEARIKSEAYCSVAERCKSEVEYKLALWEVSPDAWEGILEHLIQEGFIDETRYATSFVRDKYRFNQWGRVKITQALRMKRISDVDIREGLSAIDEEEYRTILIQLLVKKRRTLKCSSDYELNGKLIRFAASHGYEMNDILLSLKQIGCNDEYMD